MANFDFSTLNSSDFEELVCSILDAAQKDKGSNVSFRTFKDGKDKGIDFLYSTSDSDYEIVGQAKHYYRSGFNTLLTHLRNSERKKVQKLKPGKYLLATSVDLSVENAEEIKKVFQPYLKSLSDIFGKKELNKYLDDFPNIVNQQFKLWYSTTEILLRILNYETIGRSNEFHENQLKKRLRLYVETPALKVAKEILEKNNFIIITGEPGVGKTSTAELLLYEYLKEGYELIYIYDDIKEAEKILDLGEKKTPSEVDHSKRHTTTKQIFYFDDFLGHNSVEIQKARGSETALLKVLKRISFSQDKKFIFTTRTFILKSAVEDSENLRRFNLKAKESTIKLDIYSKGIRRQLLINHVEESDLSAECKQVLQKPDLQDFIVNHLNFSPRSVEFITSNENIEGLSAMEYEKFILENFNKPDEIWRHAYEQQINDLDRILLNTMLSFGDSVYVQYLEVAYNSRIDYEVKFNNYVRPLDAFRRSFKRLEGGFIVQETHDPYRLRFINPSLVDFLLSYLRGNYNEVIRISESAFFLSQLTIRLFPLDKTNSPHISPLLKERLTNHYDYFIKPESQDSDRLVLVILLAQNFRSEQVENIIINLLSEIDDWSFLADTYSLKNSLYVFLKGVRSERIIALIRKHGSNVFANLILSEDDLEDLMQLLKMIAKKFEVNLKELFAKDDFFGFSAHVNNLLSEKIEQDIDDLLDYPNAQDYVDEKETEMVKIIERFSLMGLGVHANLSEYGKYDWWQIGINNYIREQMQKDD